MHAWFSLSELERELGDCFKVIAHSNDKHSFKGNLFGFDNVNRLFIARSFENELGYSFLEEEEVFEFWIQVISEVFGDFH